MSLFREALRAKLITALHCPKCEASNRPGVTYIDLDATGSRAYCSVCAVEGPIEKFQLPPKETAHA